MEVTLEDIAADLRGLAAWLDQVPLEVELRDFKTGQNTYVPCPKMTANFLRMVCPAVSRA